MDECGRLIEVNTFTNPEPFETRELQIFIAEVLTEKGETDLIEQYVLEGCPMCQGMRARLTISLNFFKSALSPFKAISCQ